MTFFTKDDFVAKYPDYSNFEEWNDIILNSDDSSQEFADAIINIRYGSSSLMQRAAEVIAYGTAVKYK